jgi:hypothetical protein
MKIQELLPPKIMGILKKPVWFLEVPLFGNNETGVNKTRRR